MIRSTMLRMLLKIGFLGAATLYGLNLILGVRMIHESNTKLPEGKKLGLISGWGAEASRLHRQHFPNSYLSSAVKVSNVSALLLASCSLVTYLLTR